MDVTPEEIKRQAIKYKKYCKEYNILRLEHIAKLPDGEIHEPKTDEQLYDEFSEGKPVSL